MYTYIYYIIVLVKKGAFYYLGPLDQLSLLICSSWPCLLGCHEHNRKCQPVELLLTTFLNFYLLYSKKKKKKHNKLLLIEYSMNEFYSVEKLMQSIMYAYKGK